jgi:hypothetical protein
MSGPQVRRARRLSDVTLIFKTEHTNAILLSGSGSLCPFKVSKKGI